MSDIFLNRCYVYSYSPFHCQVCGKILIGREYYFISKKGKTIRNRADYCPNCNAFVIKYGTYIAQKKNWIVLNGQDLQRVAQEYNNRAKKAHYPQFKKGSSSSNSSRYVYYDAPGLSRIREEERLARNLAAKENRIREEKEKEKKEELKKKLEDKEAQRIRQLQEFERKREKEYQRRLAESRARHATNKHEKKQAKRIANEAIVSGNTVGKSTIGIKNNQNIKKIDDTKNLSSSPANMRKVLIARGIIKTSTDKRSAGSKASHLTNKNGDHIITAHDFVVRRTVFKCKHNNHHIEDVKAVFTTISRQGTVNKITIPAGYCSTCNMYFIMESTYKRIKNSGIPICRTMDEKSYENNISVGLHNYNLASESVLMQFGYNVSQKDDLPAEQRRRILAAIVDNKVLKRNEVVSYLDYFINQRKNQKNKDGSLRYKDAMDKWRMDRAWINKYKLGSYKEVIISSIVTNIE